MNEEVPPPTLPYATPAPPRSHGPVFTALLIVVGLLCFLIIGQFFIMRKTGMFPDQPPFVFYYIIFMQSLFLFAIVLAIVLRASFPSLRRTITIAVSIFLLLHFPFGTAVGIYGLSKVDRSPRP
jgi:hypothetical protein